MEQIHIVNGDKFIKVKISNQYSLEKKRTMFDSKEPWSELQELETFLEIKKEINENNFYFNATKGILLNKLINYFFVYSDSMF